MQHMINPGLIRDEFIDSTNEEEVRNALDAGIVHLKFIKADGTTRFMQATLNEHDINQKLESAELFNKQEYDIAEDQKKDDGEFNYFVQKVFDFDIGEFRSFVWSRLVSATRPIDDE